MAEQHGLQPGQDEHPADDNSSHLRTGKRGRKPDDIREFFTVVEGTYVSTSKRSAHRCNGCGEVIPATTSTQHNLKDHVLNRCSQPEPAAQLLALGQEPAAGASSGPDAAPGPAPAASKKRRVPSGQLPYAAPAVLSPQQQQAVSENLLRFLVTSGTPLEAVRNPYLAAALQGLSSSYALPTPPAVSTSILVQEYASCCLHLYQLLQSAAVTSLTVSAAVWEDAQGRQVLVVLVLLPDGTCRLLEAQQLSRDTCSSSIAGFIRDVLMRYNIVEKVLLLVAGEGPGLHQATQLVVASDGFKHILATRCLRTAVSSIVDAAVSHPWAQQLLVAAQRLVLSLGAWPGPGALGAAGGLAGTMRPISSSCPLSVMECLDSLLVHQQALQQLQQQQQHQQLHQQLHQPQQQQEEEEGTWLALPLLDEQVWLEWQLLADVLRPLYRALAGIAAAQANLADATRCLLHLVAGVAAALPHVPDSDQAAVGAAVLQQLQQVDAPLCRLALFLDPRFRLAALNRSSSSSSSSAEAPNNGSSRGHPAGGGGWQHEGDMLTTVQDTAALYAHSRGYTPADITQLLDQLSAYSSGEDPYQLPWPTLQLDSGGSSNGTGSSAACRSWWRDVRAAGSQGSHLLADLAMQLLSGTPHCALHPWARTNSTSSSSSLSSGWALAGEQRTPGNPGGVTGAMVAAVKLCHQGHALAHQHNQHQAHLAVQALGGGSSSSTPSLEALQEMGLPPELASSIQSLAAAVRSEAGGLPLGLSMQSSSAAPVAAAAGTGAGFTGAVGAPAAAATSNGVGGGVAGSSLLVPGGLSNAAGLALTHAAAAAAFIGAQAAPFMAVAPVAWAAAAEAAAGSLLMQQQGHISLAAALAAAAAPAADGDGMSIHHRAAADGTAALSAAELAGLLAVLFEQQRERQQQQGHGAVSCLPADASSWSQAVSGAFGQWDVSADLLGPGYREVLQPSQRTIQAPADCDPLEVVRSWRQRKQQQQQQQQQQ